MFYELKLQCTRHSRAKIGLWVAQPAINKDKALPGRGLGRVTADSVISFFTLPPGPHITRVLGHCPLDSAQRRRETAKQFMSSKTECTLGLLECLGSKANYVVPTCTARMAGQAGPAAQAGRACATRGTWPPHQGVSLMFMSPLNFPTLDG